MPTLFDKDEEKAYKFIFWCVTSFVIHCASTLLAFESRKWLAANYYLSIEQQALYEAVQMPAMLCTTGKPGNAQRNDLSGVSIVFERITP